MKGQADGNLLGRSRNQYRASVPVQFSTIRLVIGREPYVCAFDDNFHVALLCGSHEGHAIHDVLLQRLSVLIKTSKLGLDVVVEQFSEALLVAIGQAPHLLFEKLRVEDVGQFDAISLGKLAHSPLP